MYCQVGHLSRVSVAQGCYRVQYLAADALKYRCYLHFHLAYCLSDACRLL